MTAILSPVDAIQNIEWVRVSNRAVNAEKVVFIDGVMIVRLGPNKLACSAEALRKPYAFMLGRRNFNGPVLTALVTLGIITEKQKKEHLKSCEAAHVRSVVNSDQLDFNRLTKKYGKGKSPRAVWKKRNKQKGN